MGKEHRPARLAIHLVSGAVLLVLAGCTPGAPPVADTPASVTSTALAPADPPAIAPGEPEVGLPPPPPASALAVDDTAGPPPPESLSPHDMELMKQSVIADWRLSRERPSERPASTVAAQSEPASPPPTSPAIEQTPPAPDQAAQSTGPIPCSMLPATATPCMRQ